MNGWRAWLRRLEAGEGPPPERAPRWFRPIARALAPPWRERDRQLAQARSEWAALTGMIESLDTAVLRLDAERRVRYGNAAARRLLHLDAPPRVGERLGALARVPELARWVEEVAAAGGGRFGRLELSDGRVWQAEVAAASGGGPDAAADRGPAGGPAGGQNGEVALLARDITQLAHLETLRRDFVAGASHELRTPVTSIRGYAEILLREPDIPAQQRRQFLASILANAERLEKLTRDLVTLSALETGQYPFHYRVLDAAELPAAAVAVLAPLASERGCELRVEAAESGWIRADADALHRALLNLIENALLHAGRGARVVVAGRREPDTPAAAPASAAAPGLGFSRGFYHLEVRDNGAGIGSADQPRVFERFYRVDKSHGAAGGSGLGLALVKHIAREHGGEVELRSELGRGAVFTLRFPLAPAPPEPAAGPATDAAAAPATGSGSAPISAATINVPHGGN